MRSQPTLFVVDEKPAIRQTLTDLFHKVGLPVETFATFQEYQHGFSPDAPGCLLLDAQIPGWNGFQPVHKLELGNEHRAPLTGFSILLLAFLAEPFVFHHKTTASNTELLKKPFDDQEIVYSVRRAMQIDAETRRFHLDRSVLEQRLRTLSKRETEVFQRMIRGTLSKHIASELGSSMNTVRNQRANILKKMKANSAVELTRMVTSLRIA